MQKILESTFIFKKAEELYEIKKKYNVNRLCARKI
jgi:hypothetical protein